MKNKGQSLVEVIFAVGLVLIVISGVTALMLSSLGSRTKSYDRQKAIELAQIVMEEIIKEKTTDPVNFWDLSSGFWAANLNKTQTKANFPLYNYSVGISALYGNNCSPTKLECLNVMVNVGWSGGAGSENFNRFFSRQ